MIDTKRIPEITVHGRFQPPLHINHWEYISQGFEKADHVTLLITNPFNDEAFDAAASWRSDPKNNPFTYGERVYLFGRFFMAMGIEKDRYEIKPFNIKDPEAFAELDINVPNLVNVYSEWSANKVEAFKSYGFEVIQLDQPKSKPVSGTRIRQLIKESGSDLSLLKPRLIVEGFMPEAIPGLFTILKQQASR